MNKFELKKIAGAAVLAASFLASYSASAQAPVTVYDNSALGGSIYSGQSYGTPLNTPFEFGDEITIGGGPGLTLSSFQFEVFGSGLSGGETVTLHLYNQNGATLSPRVVAPGTEIALTGNSSAMLNGLNTVTFTPDAGEVISLPGNFTWSVTFTGVGPGERA